MSHNDSTTGSTSQYFTNCHSTDEIKTEYRHLAKQHHPDMGGNTATMQAVNAAYAFAMAQATRQEKPGKTEQEYTDLASVHDAIRAAIERIISLDGLDIEICGLWVWVSGNTRANKEALKAAGYRWASKKERWYFAGVPANGRGRSSMDEIRFNYGSQKVSRKDDDSRRPHFAGALA